MVELRGSHCEPCEQGGPPLSEEDSARWALQIPLWQRDRNLRIHREFRFDTFRDAFGLATRIALLAEAEGHHPDMEVGWGRVGVSLSTHSVAGLSRNDFIMAAKIDDLVLGGVAT